MQPSQFVAMLTVLATFVMPGFAVHHRAVRGLNRQEKNILSCLLSRAWVREDMRQIGIAKAGQVHVRMAYGAVPGTSPRVAQWNVIVYSPNHARAWLLFARLASDGRIHAIPNAYSLVRDRNGWAAGEGNGGIATYRAMGAYATHLSRLPLRSVLIPGRGPGGCVSDF